MRWTWFEEVTGQWLDKSLGAVFERPEVKVLLERRELLLVVAEQAREVARSDVDDPTALDELSDSLPADRELVRDTAEHLAGHRTRCA